VGKDSVTVVVFSGELDKALAAFNIATTAASMDMEVTMFFTFWGLGVVQKDSLGRGRKSFMQWVMGMVNRGGASHRKLSKMNMLGLGKWLVKRKMKKAGAASLEKLLQDFKELGGKVLACDMTMEIMGIKKEDLREDLISEYCAVGTYISEARESTVTLFI